MRPRSRPQRSNAAMVLSNVGGSLLCAMASDLGAVRLHRVLERRAVMLGPDLFERRQAERRLPRLEQRIAGRVGHGGGVSLSSVGRAVSPVAGRTGRRSRGGGPHGPRRAWHYPPSASPWVQRPTTAAGISASHEAGGADRSGEARPWHRRAACSSRLRARALHLRRVPFRQPRARQHLGRGHGGRLEYHVWVWHSVAGTAVLYSALLVHALLGLWALYERRHFRWKVVEGIQLAFGLSIPPLLAAHLVGQRIALEFFGIEKGYAQVLWGYWVPGTRMGCGSGHPAAHRLDARLHRRVLLAAPEAFFRPAAPFLLAVAVLLPALALLGYYQGGRTIVELSTARAVAGGQPQSGADRHACQGRRPSAGPVCDFSGHGRRPSSSCFSRAGCASCSSAAAAWSGSTTPTAGPSASRAA